MLKKQLKIFKSPPCIETERIKLVKIEEYMLNDVYEYSSDASVSEFLLWSIHESKEYTREYLKYIKHLYKKCNFFDWAIIIKTENKMIGTCGFSEIDIKNNRAFVGYVLNSKYWNRGIATEALRLVIDFAFENLNLSEIHAKFMSDNFKSKKTLEKCGFIFDEIKKEKIVVKGIEREVEFAYLKNPKQ